MSRRHHGRPRHGGRNRPEGARPAPGTDRGRPPASVGETAPNLSGPRVAAPDASTTAGPEIESVASEEPGTEGDRNASPSRNDTTTELANPAPGTQTPSAPAPTTPVPPGPAPSAIGAAPGPLPVRGTPGMNGGGNGHPDRGSGCTAPQLRRFIKSRPYVPMHELRRRFAIEGDDDDVTQVRLADGAVYVGLPAREGSLLGELLRGGEIGFELSLDPCTPIVIGVYPMRPVPRG